MAQQPTCAHTHLEIPLLDYHSLFRSVLIVASKLLTCHSMVEDKNCGVLLQLHYSRRISGTCNSTISDIVGCKTVVLCMWGRPAAGLVEVASLAVQLSERLRASILQSLLLPEFPPTELLCFHLFSSRQSRSFPVFLR